MNINWDIRYFDGIEARKQGLTREPAGYSRYTKTYTWYRDIWEPLKARFNFQPLIGKKIIDLGCAKGFFVEEFRAMGIDCWGMDISQYAIDAASSEVRPYLYVGDARTDLSQFKANEFDLAFSIGLLECLTEIEVPDVIAEINRICKQQLHGIMMGNEHYLVRSLDWWIAKDFRKGTKIFRFNDVGEAVK